MIMGGDVLGIILYIMVLGLGIFVGYNKILTDRILDKLGYIQTYSLLILLFIMGISIGLDENILNYFGVIGYYSIVLSTFSIIFSILGIKLVSNKILSREKRVKGDS